jgi:pyrimidine operon attenuation protein/uracil phosphoribosyltransferase
MSSHVMSTLREKNQLMSASEIDRTMVRLAHEVLEKSPDLENLAFIGCRAISKLSKAAKSPSARWI